MSELGSSGVAIDVTHPVWPCSSPRRLSVSAMLSGGSLSARARLSGAAERLGRGRAAAGAGAAR